MLFVSDGCVGRNFNSEEFARNTRTEVVSLAIQHILGLCDLIADQKGMDMD